MKRQTQWALLAAMVTTLTIFNYNNLLLVDEEDSSSSSTSSFLQKQFTLLDDYSHDQNQSQSQNEPVIRKVQNHTISSTKAPIGDGAILQTHAQNRIQNKETTTKTHQDVDISATAPTPTTATATAAAAATANTTAKSSGGSTISIFARNPPLPATIVVLLKGEMGNHISGLAQGKGLQWELERKYEDLKNNTRLVLRHVASNSNAKFSLSSGSSISSKGKKTRDTLQACFPELSKLHFSEGDEAKQEFRATQRAQRDWLTVNQSQALELVNGHPLTLYEVVTNETMLTSLQTFYKLYTTKYDVSNSKHDHNNNHNNNNNNNMPELELELELEPKSKPNTTANNRLFSMPFLFSKTLASNFLVDQHYEKVRHFFRLNETCCAKLPDPDETVLHFRNFGTELSFRAKTKGFSDLSPNKTASLLLGQLVKGDKVAITTRFHNSRVQEYVTHLEQRGLKVRVVAGQTGIQDFCFLLKAQQQLVGNVVSTFARWAAILGDAKVARLYIHDTIGLRNMVDQHDLMEVLGFSWTHASLRERVKFEVYPSEFVEQQSGYSNSTNQSSIG